MTTRVVHVRVAPYDVYIGRPGPWGNPFVVGRDGKRGECVARYAEWIRTQPQLLARLGELKGRVLGCWCKGPATPDRACHGDVLAALADAYQAPLEDPVLAAIAATANEAP